VARHVARTRLSQWQEQRTTLPGQSKQSRAKLLADSSRHVKTQFYPLMWLSNTYIMSLSPHSPPKIHSLQYSNPDPFHAFAPGLWLPSNININGKDQTWIVLCAIYKSLDVSYFRLSSNTYINAHTLTHTFAYIHTCTYKCVCVYLLCAYGQYIRHIKLQDAIKRVKSIVSLCVW